MSLRGALTANLPLKLTSLGLSVLLWFLAAAEEPASTLVPVDVVAVQPPNGPDRRAPPAASACARLPSELAASVRAERATVEVRVLAPAGVEARALPDSLSLVRRRADG